MLLTPVDTEPLKQAAAKRPLVYTAFTFVILGTKKSPGNASGEHVYKSGVILNAVKDLIRRRFLRLHRM